MSGNGKYFAAMGIACGAVAMAAATVRADMVTVGMLQDAMIFGTSANADTGNASGMGPALFAGADGSSNKKRSLLEFNVAGAAIPTNATITGVTMTLYLAQVAGSGGGTGGGGNFPSRTLRLFDLEQSWTQGNSGSPTSTTVGGQGQGFPRQNGDVTWDYASYNSNPALAVTWNNGSDLPGGNFAATESADSTFTNFTTLNAPFTWSSAGMVADVQSWVDGAATNNGWLLKSDLETSATSFLGFWSKEGAAANNNSAIAPSLTITFTVPGEAPEPASLTLLASAGGMLVLRRRR